MMEILGYVLAALAGVSLGLTGGGGSVLTVPVLVYAFGIEPLLATSYSLFIVGSTSVVGTIINYRKGFVQVNAALLFALSSISIVFITRKILLPAIPDILFDSERFKVYRSTAAMVLFGILMMVASIAMIKDKSDQDSPPFLSGGIYKKLPVLLLYGAAVGLITGLLGAGGGFLLIPALTLGLKMPMKQAVGASLLIIALNSLIGFTADLNHFNIDWKFLIPVTVIAIMGMFTGSRIARKVEGNRLRKYFGWFVLVIGISILIREILFR